MDKPSLAGRYARCHGDEKTLVPSSYDLAFFEYKGPGSKWGQEVCANCKYTFLGHMLAGEHRYAAQSHKFHNVNCKHCTNFTPIGEAEYDSYYCGHAGWD